MSHRRLLWIVLATLCAAVNGVTEEQTGVHAPLGVSISADVLLPRVVDAESVVSYTTGTTAELSYAPVRFAEALVRGRIHSLQLDSDDSLVYYGGAVGLGLIARLSDRVSLHASSFAGLGRIPDVRGESYGLYELGSRIEAGFRLSAAFRLGLSAGFERLATPGASLFDAIGGSIRLRLSPRELSPTHAGLRFERIHARSIFPVLRSWYDSEPLGTVTIRNDEEGPVENLRVWFYAPHYMGGPRLSAEIDYLRRGQIVEVPLHAVFDERVLRLTENVTTTASVQAEYTFLGSRRRVDESVTLSLHHRNAMTWEDDSRAAAFVSTTDPAALWFSRYASSIVRDRMRGEIPQNVQIAAGVFEALQLYGVNYVVDPNSAYVEMSGDASVIDYLQYPSQTLMYRGGDCDDLSILYASLLESLGIATAFVTIPGHIYLAFDTGLSEEAAREQFFDPGLLVMRDGRAWAPIEITMVGEGFVKAWRIGAKQWIDGQNSGTADFLPMEENWVRYQPSGLQDASARFDLPAETLVASAFDSAVNRFVLREYAPVIARYERRLELAREAETINEYGIALAEVGLLDEAWELFVEAARSGYPWAWINLANVAFVREDHELAQSYYEWAHTLLPGDPLAILGSARCAYELDRYSESEDLHAVLRGNAPSLADDFGYLASAYGGSGRAWSMADRLARTIWSIPGMSFGPEEPARVVSPRIEITEPAAVAAASPASAPDEAQPARPVAGEPREREAGTSALPETARVPTAAAVDPPASQPAVPNDVAEPAEMPRLPVEVATDPPTRRPPAVADRAPVDTRLAVTPVAPAPAPAPAVTEEIIPEPPEITPEPTTGGAEPAVTAAAEPEPVPAVAATAEPPAARDHDPVDARLVKAPVHLPELIRLTGDDSVGPAALPDPRSPKVVDFVDSSAQPGSGRWAIADRTAVMTDPRSMYGRLVLARAGSSGPTAYEFQARSSTAGFAGFGIHIHGRGAWDSTSYGGGDSILIWVTRDPYFYFDYSPRLQVYRSRGEVDMSMIASTRIPGTMSELRSYRVEYDPTGGTLMAFVDGVLELTLDDLGNEPDYDFAALRALGRAEFHNLEIESLHSSDRDGEAHHE